MEKENIEVLAKKYLQGETELAQTKQVLCWFRTKAGQTFLQQNIDKDFASFDQSKILTIDNLDEQENELLEKVLATHQQSQKESYWVYKIAASVAAILLVAVAYAFYQSYYPKQYSTNFGEKKSLTLSDGTHVMLNGHSSIRVSLRRFWSSEREVWLTGEAYFDVAHTENHDSFVVHTTDMDVHVLGTKFNVNHRDKNTRVSLESGKVKLVIGEKAEKVEMLMKPGDVVEHDEASAYLIKTKKRKVVELSSWKDNKLFFDQSTISEVARMIENTYGLKLIVHDSHVLQQQINGSVNSENLDAFIEGLADILNVEIVRDGKLIYLHNRQKP